MAKFFKVMKLCLVIMIMELGHLATVPLCSLAVLCAHLEWMEATLSHYFLVWETWLMWWQRRLFSAYSCFYFGISSAFCSNTSSLPLGRAWSITLSTTIMQYISPRTNGFTISSWSSNHRGALKCFTSVSACVVVSMAGCHQDSTSVFLA